MDSVIITGASGFIGGYLAAYFSQKKYNVLPYSKQKLYEMNESDFTDVDYIIHCAAYGNYSDQDNELETIDANFQLLYNLLTLTQPIKYKAFINFSSSSVLLPYDTFYSATKAAGERILTAYVNKYNKPALSIRPYTVTGPGEQQRHLIPTLINSCMTGVMMDFASEPVHDYIHVNDICESVDTAMLYASQLKGKAIDVGTGVMTSNDQVKSLVEKYTQKKAVIRRVDSVRLYDNYEWRCKYSELSKYGWKPKYTVEEAIKEMVYESTRSN
mgnify:CR=1 FL=1